MTISTCVLLASCLLCIASGLFSAVTPKHTIVKNTSTYDDSCMFLARVLPALACFWSSLRQSHRSTKPLKLYKNITIFACSLLASCLFWLASGLLCGVRLASFWPFCYTGVVVSARQACSVWHASGSLCRACVVWVWPAVAGPRPKNRLFLIGPFRE